MPVLKEVLSGREKEILRLISEGSSDREIAGKLYLSINTVKWHNRQIYAKLEVGSRTEALAIAAERKLLEDLPVQADQILKTKMHNLPAQLSSFIGRNNEIQQITELLKTTRLLTLTGPGGVGKTRLALEIARELLTIDAYKNRVYFIELAPVVKAELVASAISEGLDLSPPPGEDIQDVLDRYLRQKEILLILDNFEHLLEGAPLVSDLLSDAPGLKVLCTSRELLNLTGEQIFPVPPLEIQSSQELFIQRTREVNPTFEPDEQELLLVDQVCARLDGLPLAIELAAARMNLFNLTGLLEKLEDRFTFLIRAPQDAPERHQTLYAAIDWSYQLLVSEEQTLFRRLSVFQGSRTIDAVQEVCCFDLKLEVLDGLESLLSKNLLKQEEGFDGETRFYLLETIHAYAADCLKDSGEGDFIRKRHARYFISLTEQAREPLLGGPENIFWNRKIEADFENIRLAHDLVISWGEDDLRLSLVGNLYGFWSGMGHDSEGKTWTENALQVIHSASLPHQAWIFMSAANINFIFHKFDISKEFWEKALSCFQLLDDALGIARCHLGLLARGVQDLDQIEIQEHFNIVEDFYTTSGNHVGLAQAWTAFGGKAVVKENIELANDAFEKALLFAEKSGDQNWMLQCMVNLACTQVDLGDAQSARKLILEVLRMELEIYKTHSLIYGTFDSLALPELALGRPGKAVTLFSAANSLRNKKSGIHLNPIHEIGNQKGLDTAAKQLDKTAYQEAWEKGQKMTFQDAVDYALEEDSLI